ncbi:hypothetical protein H4R21_001097 [Coemansia helicoidea]|uniref:Uncharacterized protein n=1 Tax=Coemansia helicoidea TaxID=1286919 RepID=A0ACC1LE77_9FUNG|nr:hypothetical protein H4R21_001097 [Coemansia helicoidea]
MSDAESQSLDALRWTENSRRRQRELATQNQQAATQRPVRAEYTADDLAGLRVAHGADGLDGGGEQVLTLQDRSIGELCQDDDDEGLQLESVAARDAERARKSAQRRKRQRAAPGSIETAHGALEDEEDEDGGAFTIGQGGRVAVGGSSDAPESRGPAQALEQAAPQAISDYYTEAEAAALFRKKKPRRQKRDKTSSTNDLLPDLAAVDTARVNSLLTRASRIDDAGLVDDDDDLLRAIATVRRAKMACSAPPAAPPEPIRPESSSGSNEPAAADDAQPESELVLSSTIEFVQKLKASTVAPAMRTVAPAAPTAAPAASVAAPAAPTAVLAAADAPAQEEEEEEVQIVKSSHETSRGRGLVSSTSRPAAEPASSAAEPAGAGAGAFEEQEPSVGTGLAATLRLLQSRSMLDKVGDEQREREKLQRSRAQWTAEHRQKDQALQRELQRIRQLGKKQPAAEAPEPKADGRRRGKADEMTQRELEELKAQEQAALDRRWAREYEERMRDYKPEVRLEYTDDTGRQLTTKEAYKQLSHAFHGHYSGKNKIDKLMRKRDAERRQMELASAEATHRHGEAVESARRKMGAAGIVISSDGTTSASGARPKQG